MTNPVGSPAESFRPVPVADDVSAGYWDGAERGELVIQFCESCHRFQHPPGVRCFACTSDELTDRAVTGRGTIYSHTLVHVPRQVSFEPFAPYLVALVALEEQPDVFVLANMWGTDPNRVTVGLPVEFWWEEIQPGRRVPQVRLVSQPVTIAMASHLKTPDDGKGLELESKPREHPADTPGGPR